MVDLEKLSDDFSMWWKRKQMDADTQLEFLKKLSRLCDHMSPSNAVNHLAKTQTGIQLELLHDLQANIKAGRLISDGLANWLDPMIVEGISIGESKGAFKAALKNAIESMGLSKEKIFRSIFNIRLMYTFFIFIFAVYATYFVNNNILELDIIKSSLAKMPELPSDIKLIQNTAYFIDNLLLPCLILVASIIAFLWYSVVTYLGEYRSKLDSLPIFYEYRILSAISFLSGFNLLKTFNLEDVRALGLIKEKTNSEYIRMHVGMAIDRFRSGNPLSESLNTGLFNKNDALTISALLGTDSSFDEVSKSIIEDMADSLKRRFTKINLILVILLMLGIVSFMIPVVSVVMGVDQYVV